LQDIVILKSKLGFTHSANLYTIAEMCRRRLSFYRW